MLASRPPFVVQAPVRRGCDLWECEERGVKTAGACRTLGRGLSLRHSPLGRRVRACSKACFKCPAQLARAHILTRLTPAQPAPSPHYRFFSCSHLARSRATRSRTPALRSRRRRPLVRPCSQAPSSPCVGPSHALRRQCGYGSNRRQLLKLCRAWSALHRPPASDTRACAVVPRHIAFKRLQPCTAADSSPAPSTSASSTARPLSRRYLDFRAPAACQLHQHQQPSTSTRNCVRLCTLCASAPSAPLHPLSLSKRICALCSFAPSAPSAPFNFEK